jgi:hypothetical protein
LVKFLGQVVLLRVENAQVRHDDLTTWFTELDLDVGFLPRRTSPVNAFKKQATGPATKLTYAAPWIHPTAVATVKWEDESHDKERIVRRAVRTVKIQNKAGTPEVVAKVTFYKRSRRAPQTGVGGEKMRFQLVEDKLPAGARPIIEQWIKDTMVRYEQGQAWVDTDALRGIAREYLTRRLKALMVRPGVYFVYREMEGEMKRLQTLVTRFGDECMFHPMELVDRPEHRGLLGQALQNELELEATNLQRELNGLRGKFPRRIPQASFAPLVTRYEGVMELARDYATAVGVNDQNGTLDRLTDTLVVMRRSVT